MAELIVLKAAGWVDPGQWQVAPATTRNLYLQHVAATARARKRGEIRRGIGADGRRLAAVQPESRRDGASGPPLAPHDEDSRSWRWLKTTVDLPRGRVVLYWDHDWGTILGYHARGEVRGAPVRDLTSGLSPDGLRVVREEASRYWGTILRKGTGGKGASAAPLPPTAPPPLKPPILRVPSVQPAPLARPAPRPGSFRTAADVIEWGKTAHPKIRFDVEELPAAVLNEVVGHFDVLAKKFPEAVEKLEYVGTFKSPDAPVKVDWTGAYANANALADSRSGRVLGLNPNKLSNLDEIKQKFTRYEEQGRYAPGASAGVRYVISHEFGHLLDASLRRNAPEAHAQLRRLVTAGDPGTISQYAKTNEPEAVAEAFASLVHAPRERKSQLAKDIGAVITGARKS